MKALEAAAKPVIEPANPKATLGTMIAALRAKPSKWKTSLTPAGPIDPIESIATMMELIWKSQLDRHGTDDESRPFSASPQEAEAAIHVAAALVHLFTSGAVQLAA